MESGITRVVLADDHPMIRVALRNLLNRQPDMQVVGEAPDGRTALEMVEKLKPDVLVLDLEMPVLKGYEVARRLRSRGSPVHILVLSAYADRHFERLMLESGAEGYLTKDEAPDTVVAVVRELASAEVQ